jgi:hypothetical protein
VPASVENMELVGGEGKVDGRLEMVTSQKSRTKSELVHEASLIDSQCLFLLEFGPPLLTPCLIILYDPRAKAVVDVLSRLQIPVFGLMRNPPTLDPRGMIGSQMIIEKGPPVPSPALGPVNPAADQSR